MKIIETKKENKERLECPYCHKRVSALGITKNSKIYDVTVKCTKCKRILEINE